ncbi:MAG: hypothetical protein SPI72_01575, partial [Porphyromonas sp.]|nr:hypothetical protein [Porphyromonas sp.]
YYTDADCKDLVSKSSLDLKRHGGYRCADRKYRLRWEEDLNSICEDASLEFLGEKCHVKKRKFRRVGVIISTCQNK